MLHGVAGVGKTTLLREFEARCGLPTVRMDGRDIPATPDGFQQAYSALAAGMATGPSVLQIDNYETLDSLDRWLRDAFLPELPASRFVLIAGRRQPSSGWRSEPAWTGLFQAIRLENLGREEAAEFLRRRSVPDQEIEEALDFTGGHPLALSLVAEVYADPANGGLPFFRSPDVIQTLIERFIEAVPDDDHRRALELSALVRVTTEALVDHAAGPDLFRWLKDLSFMERTTGGLRPHELARTAIVADLKWRNPSRYRDLRDAARGFYRDALTRLTGEAQLAILFDYIYLHRENPVIAGAFEFDAEAACYADSLLPEDVPAIVNMVLRHEGGASAEIAEQWIGKQRENVTVIRGAAGAQGFLLSLSLENLAASVDPAVDRALAYLEKHGPLRPGERCTLARFWMGADGYQSVSQEQSLIFVQIVRQMLTTPHLAVTMLSFRNPEVWSPIFSYAGLNRVEEADFEVGGVRYGVYAHDWRLQPPLVWLEMLAERETLPAAPAAVAPLQIFARSEFAEALQQALRDALSPEKLKTNPLMRSRMVADRMAQQKENSVRALLALLKEAALTMRAEANDQKLLRVLRACCFEPCPSQEVAAEKLEIGIATLRRHLKEATGRVVDYLWEKETA